MTQFVAQDAQAFIVACRLLDRCHGGTRIGNDGLRGIPIAITQSNLAQMIEAFQAAGAKVVLAGMTLPPNYGPQYISQFEKVYRDLAATYKVKLIPFLLEGVGGHTEFMQRDGLHPNAQGAKKVETLVMGALEGML